MGKGSFASLVEKQLSYRFFVSVSDWKYSQAWLRHSTQRVKSTTSAKNTLLPPKTAAEKSSSRGDGPPVDADRVIPRDGGKLKRVADDVYTIWISNRRSLGMTAALFLVLTLMFLSGRANADERADGPLPPSITTAPLPVDQVVANLVRNDIARAQALRHYECTRVYHLAYRGFPGDRDAEMTVEASYDSPATKSFKVISQSGSKLILDRVFKRLLESEKEAVEPEMHARTLLNRDNYNFALIGFESSEKGGQYELEVRPKVRSKYVYVGKIWVDGTDFAVTKIEAEPAQNPSFWTKKNDVHHEYIKVQNFWVPRRNESVSYIRLGGRATLTIDYSNYRVNDSLASGDAKASSSAAH